MSGDDFWINSFDDGEKREVPPEPLPVVVVERKPQRSVFGSVVAVAILLAAIWSCSLSSCSTPAETDAQLAGLVLEQLDAEGIAEAVHDVDADVNGSVDVTMNSTSDSMGGLVIAQDVASGVAVVTFQVPRVTEVTVFDSNLKVIGSYDR